MDEGTEPALLLMCREAVFKVESAHPLQPEEGRL